MINPENFSLGGRGAQPSGKLTREVYDALCGAPIQRVPSARRARSDPTLFELAELFKRFEAIDEQNRLSDRATDEGCESRPSVVETNGNGPPLASLSPERLDRLRDLVARAYADVRDGCSADRMIADEALNDEFLRRCWELGAVATAYELNWYLLNARKAGALQSSGGTRRFRIPADRLHEFTFATEFAIRHIQNEYARNASWSLSLDRILCDPRLAAEFDDTARRIAPGYSSLEYRWAAFTVRKARRPYRVPFHLPFDVLGDTQSVRTHQLPSMGGVYRFRSEDQDLYVGETDDIRRQIAIHFDNNGTAVFPDWLLGSPRRRIELLVCPMQRVSSATERSRAKTFFTDKWVPQFNWLGRQPTAA